MLYTGSSGSPYDEGKHRSNAEKLVNEIPESMIGFVYLITNTTNNRIREHVRSVENIWVYVLPLPIVKEKILGYKCETSYVKGLEYNLLKEYKDKHGVVPPLNVFIK